MHLRSLGSTLCRDAEVGPLSVHFASFLLSGKHGCNELFLFVSFIVAPSSCLSCLSGNICTTPQSIRRGTLWFSSIFWSFLSLSNSDMLSMSAKSGNIFCIFKSNTLTQHKVGGRLMCAHCFHTSSPPPFFIVTLHSRHQPLIRTYYEVYEAAAGSRHILCNKWMISNIGVECSC